MGDIITTSKCSVIIIDPNLDEVEKAKEISGKSIEKIAIININFMFSRFGEINKLMSDGAYWKFFYGCKLNRFNNLIAEFNSKNGDVTYLGWNLDIPQIESYYWEKKGYEVSPPNGQEL